MFRFAQHDSRHLRAGFSPWFMIYNRREANCNRQLFMQTRARRPSSAAKTALFLLLGVNLFNYIDRQILAALEP